MMKLRTRALKSLQNDGEGEGVRLDASAGKKNKNHRDAMLKDGESYEFTSITESTSSKFDTSPKLKDKKSKFL